MREYSPKRRTAVVFTGSGTSGAYHAGVLKALDESGVKIDLLVGSGAGAVAAAFGAVAGGAKLYGPDGFWDGASWASFYRLRLSLRLAILLLAMSFGVFLLPVLFALLAGLLFPLLMIVDVVRPGLSSGLIQALSAAPSVLRAPYLAALAVPIFFLSLVAVVGLARLWMRDRRRVLEGFEAVLEIDPAQARLGRGLWEVARGAALGDGPPTAAELGRRYIGLLSENLGQPGFRELIVRVADLDTGDALSFVALDDAHRATYAAARGRAGRSKLEAVPGTIDLRAKGYDVLFFDALLTGVLPPVATPVRRVAFPKGGVHAGEVHRLTDGTLVGASGISEAVAAGADQILVVSAVPEDSRPLPRRRGGLALVDGVVATLERQAVDREIDAAARLNRVIETLGHRTDDGGRAWQDPASGRLLRECALYVIRPDRRGFGPLELDGAIDPSTEVLETTDDLLEVGYKDAYRLFIEPVVGAEPRVPMPEEAEQAVEL